MEFYNKTVIITGASVGIGKATAIEFARNGANVCIVDVNAEGLDTLAEEIKSIGANVSSYICDVSDEQSLVALLFKQACNTSSFAAHHNYSSICELYILQCRTTSIRTINPEAAFF